MNISLVIPVYHEEKTIGKVLDRIIQKVKTSHEIIVISDGKGEPTFDVVKAYIKKHPNNHIHVFQNTNKGVMNTIKMGMKKAKGKAIVVTMADMSDDVTQVDQMYDLIQKGYDIVCASRFMKGGKKIGGTLLKNFLSKTADVTLHFLLRIPTHDSTNAFKMYKKSSLDTIEIESTGGFEYSLEIILKAFKKGYKITEIPTIWKDREEGKSNFKLFHWLPNYLHWYFYGITLWWELHKETIKQYSAIATILLLTVFISLLQIGSGLSHKIIIHSGLDFSWMSDAVERMLHGYIGGRDYIFTYGPLLQLLHGLPALLFKLPGYISLAIASLFINILVAFGVIIFSKKINKDTKQYVLLAMFLLFGVGLISDITSNSALRIFAPLFYTSLLLGKQYSWVEKILIVMLPSIFGLYVYDLFIQLYVFLGLYCLISFLKNKKNVQWPTLFLASGIIQLATSWLLTGKFNYIIYSLETLKQYFYIMNIPWEFGRSNYLLIFPVVMVSLLIYLKKKNLVSKKQFTVFGFLTLCALLQLRSGLIRSDVGHIISSLYPSIIVTFSILYFVVPKKPMFISIGIILFTILPYKPNYYDYLSFTNIKEVFSVIKYKPAFFSLYTMPQDNVYTEKEINFLLTFINSHRGEVYVYPYDSYLLNTQRTTFNAFPLQFYDYSQDSVEQKAVNKFRQHAPKYIIWEIDTKGVVALDGIPNVTRNPIFTQWVLQNYTVEKQSTNFLLLIYSPNVSLTTQSHQCSVYSLIIKPNRSLIDVLYSLFKPPFYFLETPAIRLPFRTEVSNYFIIEQYESSENFAKIFQTINFSSFYNNQEKIKQIQLYKINPFNKRKTTYKGELTVHCFN